MTEQYAHCFNLYLRAFHLLKLPCYTFITDLDWRLKRNRLSRRHTNPKKKRNCKHPIFQKLNISLKESDIGAKRRVFIHTLFLRQKTKEKENFYPFISDLGHDEVVGTHTRRCYVFIHFLFLREGKEISVPIIQDLFIIIIAPSDVIFS